MRERGMKRERDEGYWNRLRPRWLCPAETGNRGDTRWMFLLRMNYIHTHAQFSLEAKNSGRPVLDQVR